MPDSLPSEPVLDIHALRRHLQSRSSREPVRLVETHISWVLLAGPVAYKVKRPVCLGYLDFTTADARRRACEEEVRLNRRLAPALYIDVVPVRGSAADPHFAATGPVVDHAVRMRRFPDGALFTERLAAGELSGAQVDRLARRIASFHEAAPAADPAGPFATPQAIEAVTQSLLAGLGAAANAPAGWLQAEAARLRPAFAARLRDGRVRECHGDLHLANVAVVDGDIVAFDCIEFDPALRWIDVMSDVAFTAMDFIAHGRRDFAFRFLDGWLERTGDHAGLAVLRYYLVHRALVRALVATLREPDARAPDYLAAARSLAIAGRGRLLITNGVSGSGKSFVTQRMLEQAGAIRLRSDVERKRVFGLGPLQRSGVVVPGGIYGAEATQRTFAALRERAQMALEAGWAVIVDAAFLRTSERAAFRELAATLRVPFAILHCHAREETLRERIGERARQGRDPSEADLAVLARQLATQEPLTPEERAETIGIDTGQPVDVGAACARWAAAGVPA